MRVYLKSILFTGLLLAPFVRLNAADLIEPWDAGLSDFEIYFGGSRDDGLTDFSLLLGCGAGGGFSIGAFFNHYSGEADELGIVGIWTAQLDRGFDLDLWALTAPRIERETISGGVHWEMGSELSWDASKKTILYARPSLLFSREGSRWHPLLGLMHEYGAVELHLELSSEEPLFGAWPMHLAIGPNVRFSKRLELIPELSIIVDRGSSSTSWAFSIGLILTPM